MNRNKKLINLGLIVVLTCAIITGVSITKLNVKAESYVYDFWKNVIPSTEGITYKETYYNKDIKYVSDPTLSLDKFGNLVDMEVDNGTIYVLDEYPRTETINLPSTGNVTISNSSKVYILNQNFQCEAVIDEFVISDYVKAKLDEFYHFSTPLDEITVDQYTSSEYVDVYDAVKEISTVKSNRMVLADISYNDSVVVRGSSLELYKDNTLIDSSNYTTQFLTSITYETPVEGHDNIQLAKAVTALTNAGYTIVVSEEEDSITSDIKKKDETFKVDFTAGYSAAEKTVTCASALIKTYPIDVTVSIGDKAKEDSTYISLDGTGDDPDFTVDYDSGKITIPAEVMSKNVNKLYTDGSVDVRIVVTCDFGEKESKKVEILVPNSETLTNAKLPVDVVSALDKDISVATENITSVIFNTSASIVDGDEVKAIYKYIDTPGRTPYIPYSADPTKASVRLNAAAGITVTEDKIYIADTGNARILLIDKATNIVEDVFLTPEDSAFYQMYRDSYETEFGTAYTTIKNTTNMYKTVGSGEMFAPRKIAVMSSGVVYCISANIYQGLIEFSVDTSFNRYLGKNIVTQSAIKKVWSKIWSETQYAAQALDLPSLFNNLAVSDDGFLYATADPDADAVTPKDLVKVINTKGNDIMKRTGYVAPDGDAVYLATTNKNGVITGSSVLTAVAISKTGNFTVSDKKRGRLFTYDAEGNLLYITGEQPGGTLSAASGGLSSSILNPVAVDYLYRVNYLGEEEETVIVLDQISNSILLFETTEFGEAVNTATYLYQNGIIMDTYQTDADGNFVLDENGNKIVVSEGAETYWRKVIKMNTNYELAYLGIGKALNRRGEYKEAMKYFKLAHNANYYSKAFSSYRDQVLNENFNLIMAAILSCVALYIVVKVTKVINEKNKKNKMKGDNED